MFLTRDKGPVGLICLWIDIEKKELYMRSDGLWAVANRFVPRIMEISAEDYSQVFEGMIPGQGYIYEICRLKFERVK